MVRLIRASTTFVVGAGASHVYNLPLGKGLLKQAKALAPESDTYQLLLTALPDGQRASVPALAAFVEDIRQHPAGSIDTFLETRSGDPLTMTIGRHVIAALMGRAIENAKTFRFNPDTDWLGYIIERMSEGARNAEEFADGNQNVRLLTFNFDSIIEDRLQRDLQRIYPQNTKTAIDALPVHHIHGRLPACPTAKMSISEMGHINPAWTNWLREAAPTIRVVRDDIDHDELSHVRKAIHRASIICFLGFSYHVENLKRLDIPDSLRKDTHQDVYGSAQDFLKGERDRISNRFAEQITLGTESDDCMSVLRKFNVFRGC